MWIRNAETDRMKRVEGTWVRRNLRGRHSTSGAGRMVRLPRERREAPEEEPRKPNGTANGTSRRRTLLALGLGALALGAGTRAVAGARPKKSGGDVMTAPDNDQSMYNRLLPGLPEQDPMHIHLKHHVPSTMVKAPGRWTKVKNPRHKKPSKTGRAGARRAGVGALAALAALGAGASRRGGGGSTALVPYAPNGRALVPYAPNGRAPVPYAPNGRAPVPFAPNGRALVPFAPRTDTTPRTDAAPRTIYVPSSNSKALALMRSAINRGVVTAVRGNNARYGLVASPGLPNAYKGLEPYVQRPTNFNGLVLSDGKARQSWGNWAAGWKGRALAALGIGAGAMALAKRLPALLDREIALADTNGAKRRLGAAGEALARASPAPSDQAAATVQVVTAMVSEVVRRTGRLKSPRYAQLRHRTRSVRGKASDLNAQPRKATQIRTLKRRVAQLEKARAEGNANLTQAREEEARLRHAYEMAREEQAKLRTTVHELGKEAARLRRTMNEKNARAFLKNQAQRSALGVAVSKIETEIGKVRADIAQKKQDAEKLKEKLATATTYYEHRLALTRAVAEQLRNTLAATELQAGFREMVDKVALRDLKQALEDTQKELADLRARHGNNRQVELVGSAVETTAVAVDALAAAASSSPPTPREATPPPPAAGRPPPPPPPPGAPLKPSLFAVLSGIYRTPGGGNAAQSSGGARAIRVRVNPAAAERMARANTVIRMMEEGGLFGKYRKKKDSDRGASKEALRGMLARVLAMVPGEMTAVDAKELVAEELMGAIAGKRAFDYHNYARKNSAFNLKQEARDTSNAIRRAWALLGLPEDAPYDMGVVPHQQRTASLARMERYFALFKDVYMPQYVDVLERLKRAVEYVYKAVPGDHPKRVTLRAEVKMAAQAVADALAKVGERAGRVKASLSRVTPVLLNIGRFYKSVPAFKNSLSAAEKNEYEVHKQTMNDWEATINALDKSWDTLVKGEAQFKRHKQKAVNADTQHHTPLLQEMGLSNTVESAENVRALLRKNRNAVNRYVAAFAGLEDFMHPKKKNAAPR